MARATPAVKRKDARSVLQIPFVKISVEDRGHDLVERFSMEAAVQDSLRLSINDLRATPLLSSPSLCPSSPPEMARSLHKIPKRALSAQISWRGLLARFLDKISKRDLLVGSLYEISVQALFENPFGFMQDASCQDLWSRSHTMSLNTVSTRGVLAKSL